MFYKRTKLSTDPTEALGDRSVWKVFKCRAPNIYFNIFKDRTGDTFRWKGENCSTAEVESVISCVGKVTDSVVYGVQVPGNEGRCAMAAIADEDLDMDALAVAVNKSLPPYARPYFVRLLKAVETTGKLK